MSKKKITRIIITALSCFMIPFFITSCNETVTGPSDTYASGSIHISVDESFKPVMEEQIKVFEKSLPHQTTQTKWPPENI